MAENDDPTPGAAEPTPAPEGETAEQTAVANDAAPPVAAGKAKFTDRVWSFRAMVAVALAALLLGGGAGAAIAAISHDDGPEHRPGFARFGPGGPFAGPGGHGGFGPGERQQFRGDLKNLRKEFRQRMKQQLQDDKNAPTPTAPPKPSPSSNG